MIKQLISAGSLVLLAACSGQLGLAPSQPADPAVVSKIIAACTADGVFKSVGGRLVLGALPYAGQADAIIAIGVDKVCAEPERFASDAATAIWVGKNLAGRLSSQMQGRLGR